MSAAGLTVRNSDIWTAYTATAPDVPILVRAAQWPLPVKAAYVLLRVKQRCVPIVADIEAIRVGLCVARAAKDADGKPVLTNGGYDLTPEDTAAVNAEFVALLAEEVTLLGCRAVTLAELGAEVRLTADDIALLGPFIVEG